MINSCFITLRSSWTIIWKFGCLRSPSTLYSINYPPLPDRSSILTPLYFQAFHGIFSSGIAWHQGFWSGISSANPQWLGSIYCLITSWPFFSQAASILDCPRCTSCESICTDRILAIWKERWQLDGCHISYSCCSKNLKQQNLIYICTVLLITDFIHLQAIIYRLLFPFHVNLQTASQKLPSLVS